VKTHYFIGDAQIKSNNPISQKYGILFIALEIEPCGLIVGACCNAILPLTRRFIRQLLVGKNINNIEALCADVEKHYHGASQRAIVVALKDAFKKYYNTLKNE
jgi:hypothetical protein